MATVPNNTTDAQEPVGFPVWVILISLGLCMAGIATGNTFIGGLGVLGLLAQIVRIEYALHKARTRETKPGA